MKVDIFRRPEINGQYSYLAVPQGKRIPEEATNTDWEMTPMHLDIELSDEKIIGLAPDDALQQIDTKGYAITSVTKIAGLGRTI